MQAHPGTLAETQAWASLALAMANAWKGPGPDNKAGEELAQVMERVAAEFPSRRDPGAARSPDAGRVVQEERQVRRGAAFRFGRVCAQMVGPQAIVEALIARVSSTSTAFDRFMVEGSGYEPRGSRRELALLHFTKGDLEKASRRHSRRRKETGAQVPSASIRSRSASRTV